LFSYKSEYSSVSVFLMCLLKTEEQGCPDWRSRCLTAPSQCLCICN